MNDIRQKSKSCACGRITPFLGEKKLPFAREFLAN
jgi:hypothetical protein